MLENSFSFYESCWQMFCGLKILSICLYYLSIYIYLHYFYFYTISILLSKYLCVSVCVYLSPKCVTKLSYTKNTIHYCTALYRDDIHTQNYRGSLKTRCIFIFHFSLYFDLHKVGTAFYKNNLFKSVEKYIKCLPYV